MNTDAKIMFFGCPLDSDEKYDAIQEKRHPLLMGNGFEDPIDGVFEHLKDSIPKGSWENIGSMLVPSWLMPKPGSADREKLTSENFISFIDSQGCRKMADQVDEFVSENILPHIPCMVGIDHSLTGGVYEALCRHYGKENLSLVIIDSHTDAVPMSALAGAIQYDAENNPDSVHDPSDPFLYNRPDSYNASSFIHTLIDKKLVKPKNLFIIGVSDFPEKKSLRIKDRRIKKYTKTYLGLRQKGVRIITKKECKLNPRKVTAMLKQISTLFVYISVDMDIGANNALHGVRFKNWTGLNEAGIYKLADSVRQIFSDSIRLAGMDVCEIDPRIAGTVTAEGQDRTYAIAANLIKKIVFNM